MRLFIIVAAVLMAGGALAQPKHPQVEVDCSAFRRNADGSWTTLKEATIQAGGSSMNFEGGTTIDSGAITFGDTDLATLLDRHCLSGRGMRPARSATRLN